MKKILLIGINARYSHPTMALYYLREYVRNLPWEISIKEFTIRTPANEIVQYIKDQSPHCVAFSVYIWNSLLVQQILQKIAYLQRCPKIILGGPEVSYNPEYWFAQYQAIDYIITSHGEEAFRELLTCDISLSDRLIYIQNPPFSQIPFPYRDDDLRNFEYRNIYYETSRGCPFLCSYCISSRKDQRLELRDIKQVKDEIKCIMKHRPRIVKFVDRTFNANKSHAHAVWKYIIDLYADAGTRFHFEIHPGLLNEDDFDLLTSCPRNLFQFEIGIQSTSPKTLRTINRKGDWDIIKPVIKRLLEMGTIHIHVDLVAGLPYEDYDGFALSFNEVFSLRANHFQLGYLKVLPGTEVEKQANEWGLKYLSDPPYEISENYWLNAESVNSIKRISKLINVLYNSHRFETTLNNLLALFPSPFHLFEELADASYKIGMKGMQWDELAGIILACAVDKSEKDNILDCLRQDWRESFKKQRYPRILKVFSS